MTKVGKSLAVSGLFLGFILVGCRGNLPSAGECETLALRSLGVNSATDLDDPRVLGAVQLLTTQCITTPYDREFLACVEKTGDLRICAVEFKRRSDAK